MTLTSFVFTELANTMKYGGGVLHNLVFTEWRHCVSYNEVLGEGVLYIITLFSSSDVTAFHRILWNSMTSTSFLFTELANTMKYGEGFLYNLVFTVWRHCVSQNEVWGRGCYITLFSPSDVVAFHRIGNIFTLLIILPAYLFLMQRVCS